MVTRIYSLQQPTRNPATYRQVARHIMIKVKKYEVQTVEHFDPDGNSLGFLNEYENADLRCQIAEEKASGYYLMFNGLKIPIEPDGKIINRETGLYDTNERLDEDGQRLKNIILFNVPATDKEIEDSAPVALVIFAVMVIAGVIAGAIWWIAS
jgi:hypothetical protein